MAAPEGFKLRLDPEDENAGRIGCVGVQAAHQRNRVQNRNLAGREVDPPLPDGTERAESPGIIVQEDDVASADGDIVLRIFEEIAHPN